jgi:hypothetical protein
MRKRWFLLVVLFAVPVACMSRFYIPTNYFDLTNETGQVIEELRVTVSGKSFAFTQVQPGEAVTGRFVTPDDESIFVVRGRMSDGTDIDDICGYVVWELAFQSFRIVVRPDGMVSCRY